jgi:hypothetical protein
VLGREASISKFTEQVTGLVSPDANSASSKAEFSKLPRNFKQGHKVSESEKRRQIVDEASGHSRTVYLRTSSISGPSFWKLHELKQTIETSLPGKKAGVTYQKLPCF